MGIAINHVRKSCSVGNARIRYTLLPTGFVSSRGILVTFLVVSPPHDMCSGFLSCFGWFSCQERVHIVWRLENRCEQDGKHSKLTEYASIVL